VLPKHPVDVPAIPLVETPGPAEVLTSPEPSSDNSGATAITPSLAPMKHPVDVPAIPLVEAPGPGEVLTSPEPSSDNSGATAITPSLAPMPATDTNLPITQASGALVPTTPNTTSIEASSASTKSDLQDPPANQAAAAPSKKFRPAATRNGR
jgi:hypothetical protein